MDNPTPTPVEPLRGSPPITQNLVNVIAGEMATLPKWALKALLSLTDRPIPEKAVYGMETLYSARESLHATGLAALVAFAEVVSFYKWFAQGTDGRAFQIEQFARHARGEAVPAVEAPANEPEWDDPAKLPPPVEPAPAEAAHAEAVEAAK
jgi:hypothetical protein